MNFKSADTLGIRLSKMVQYISVPILVLELSRKMFQTQFLKKDLYTIKSWIIEMDLLSIGLVLSEVT